MTDADVSTTVAPAAMLVWLLCTAALGGALLGVLHSAARRVLMKRPCPPTSCVEVAADPSARALRPTLKKSTATVPLAARAVAPAKEAHDLRASNADLVATSKTGIFYADYQWGYKWCASLGVIAPGDGTSFTAIMIQQHCPANVEYNRTPQARWTRGWWNLYNIYERTSPAAAVALTVNWEQIVHVTYTDYDGNIWKRMFVAGLANDKHYFHDWELLAWGAASGMTCSPSTAVSPMWHNFWVWARNGENWRICERHYKEHVGWLEWTYLYPNPPF